MGEQGFDFRINPVFLLVVFLFILGGQLNKILICFTLVFLHESVHLLVAYFLGFEPLAVELFPFGGMAEYGGLISMSPVKEILIALAGPLFNLAFALLIYYLINLRLLAESKILLDLFRYNIIIGTFNLLPALPLDGGRVLRAWLVKMKGFPEGTVLALKIARVFALLLALLSIILLVKSISGIWVLLLSFFIYGATFKEDKQKIYLFLRYLSSRRDSIAEIDQQAIHWQVISSDFRVKDLIKKILPGKFNMFYVLNDSGQQLGLITEMDLIDHYFIGENEKLLVKEIM